LKINVREEDLFDHFSKYGTITEVEVIREEIKGLSKGYGFIRCIDQSVVSKILASTHKIQGRVVDVNHASEKWETEKNKQEIYQTS